MGRWTVVRMGVEMRDGGKMDRRTNGGGDEGWVGRWIGVRRWGGDEGWWEDGQACEWEVEMRDGWDDGQTYEWGGGDEGWVGR